VEGDDELVSGWAAEALGGDAVFGPCHLVFGEGGDFV
jgi:hypothetical protein